MKPWSFALILILVVVAGQPARGDMRPPLEPATSDQFATGQVWKYQTRPSEPDSRVVIGRVENAPNIGIVIHVKIIGLRVENTTSPDGLSPQITHVPITENALARSVKELNGELPDLEGFSAGYETWLAAYQNSDGGVFTLELAEVVDWIEYVVNRGDVKHRDD